MYCSVEAPSGVWVLKLTDPVKKDPIVGPVLLVGPLLLSSVLLGGLLPMSRSIAA